MKMKIDKEKYKIFFRTSIQSMKYKYIFYILKRKNSLFNITFGYLKKRKEVYCEDCMCFIYEKNECNDISNRRFYINKSFKKKVEGFSYKEKPSILNNDNYCKNYIYASFPSDIDILIFMVSILMLALIIIHSIWYCEVISSSEIVVIIILMSLLIYCFLKGLKGIFKIFF